MRGKIGLNSSNFMESHKEMKMELHEFGISRMNLMLQIHYRFSQLNHFYRFGCAFGFPVVNPVLNTVDCNPYHHRCNTSDEIIDSIYIITTCSSCCWEVEIPGYTFHVFPEQS
ncbi:unnamed protein product [Coffea canephora]|uniref:Uncharacterized protein n=1 Tax=Coffea canephora TaxID=49390 RepID=A0A068UU73_COFCA|nr:unnamed protein product [Coffea canephora]